MTSIFSLLTPFNGRRTDDWTDDLKKETSGEISKKAREDANKAIEEASKSPQTLVQMIKEMQELVKDGNDLDTRLLDIQNLVEKANIPSKREAKTHREAYEELLWDSRSISGSGKASADDFRGDMIDLIMMDDVSFSEKIAELKNWNSITLAKGSVAFKQPEEFEKFVDALRAYGVKVEKEIQNKDSEAKKRLLDLTSQIDSANTEIESISVDVVTPIVAYLKLGAGAFAGVISGSPISAFSALLKAVADGVPELMKFDAQLKAAQAKRQALYSKIDKLKAQVRALENDQVRIGDASTVPSSIIDICAGITKFAGRMTKATNAFSQLSAEQDKIRSFLEKQTPVTDPLFVSQVNMLKEVLGVSIKLLDIYAKAPLSN
ncbi:hypothetical protein EUX98_g2920 [Antrodiella citrinella]|uniref:Uncharacterized protein n=1 Tax=Antrodiella citrinella TaxID=2447956 RepID=A0A4S4N0K9_9APHY|nr:hypothetical protein EUX98_g2920 [Antrodiella citrinella]